jgi:hypothetical protein
MKYSKLFATVLGLFASLTFVCAQNPNKQWEFGGRVATDYSAFYYKSYINPHYQRNFSLNAGAYATRFLNNRWSLRGELAVGSEAAYNNNNYSYNYLSAALFPRYRMNRWLDLEFGLEARKYLSPIIINGISDHYRDKNGARLWGGAALHLGKIELNLRYAPGYQPNTPFVRGGWNHTIQTGISIPLFRK